MAKRGLNTLILTIVLAFFLLLFFISINKNRADSGTQNKWASQLVAQALERFQASGTSEPKGRVQKYSIQNVPKFCSSLKSPLKELPVLAPSVAGYELNEMGKDGSLAQDDERIINYLWDHCDIFLRPPDGRKSTFTGKNPSMGQDSVVRKLLGSVPTNGFYVECGALDGILSSNTFQFEKEYEWKGLLLEPDPSNLKKLYAYHRNAWISHSCLSTTPYPQEVIFQPDFDLGRISEVVDPDSDAVKLVPGGKKQKFNVQCFPLYSFLVALNVTTIDYFSLDIEGDELKVLKTIPFDKVLIKVISVEYLTSEEGDGPLREFMESKDYITANRFYHQDKPFDLIFVHKSVNVSREVLKELAVNV